MPTTTVPRINLKLPRRDHNVPRSQTERLWLIGGGLIAFVLFLIGYFFFISPQRAETSDVNGQVEQVNQQNAVLQQRINTLREQNKNLAKYEADLAKARLALPSTSGISDFLRTLQALGNATLTDVTALNVGQPTDVSLAAAAVPGAAGATSTSTPGAPASTAPAVRPATASVYALPITASVTGSPQALEKFLDQLQAVQPRAVLITDISQSAAAASAGQQGRTAATTTLQLTMQAFVAPSSPTENASLSSAATN